MNKELNNHRAQSNAVLVDIQMKLVLCRNTIANFVVQGNGPINWVLFLMSNVQNVVLVNTPSPELAKYRMTSVHPAVPGDIPNKSVLKHVKNGK
jgi:hypothetical protein